MKKLLFITIFVLISGLILPIFSFAQGMMGNETGMDSATLQNDDGHTAREEAEGKEVWEKLQAKQITCSEISDEDFGALGEYFMGQMMGTAHEAMNNMMIQMMGQEGEEEVHVVMGKRFSGCDTSAAFPAQGIGFMPMMNMMMGGWSSPSGLNNNLNNSMMSGFGNNTMGLGFGLFGPILMLLFWVLIIIGIVMLVKWLAGQSRDSHREKSPLEILKERYAKGEIDKKEFEERKKDLI